MCFPICLGVGRVCAREQADGAEGWSMRKAFPAISEVLDLCWSADGKTVTAGVRGAFGVCFFLREISENSDFVYHLTIGHNEETHRKLGMPLDLACPC